MVFTVIFYVISNVFFKCLKNLFKKISYCDGVGGGKLVVSVCLVPFF